MAEGTKFDQGKARFDLIPPNPFFELGELFEKGARKYGDRNWEKGIKWGRIFAAMMRHAWNWWRGEQRDPEDGQHHLASVAWGALVLMEYERTHPEFDDRPSTDLENRRQASRMLDELHEKLSRGVYPGLFVHSEMDRQTSVPERSQLSRQKADSGASSRSPSFSEACEIGSQLDSTKESPPFPDQPVPNADQ